MMKKGKQIYLSLYTFLFFLVFMGGLILTSFQVNALGMDKDGVDENHIHSYGKMVIYEMPTVFKTGKARTACLFCGQELNKILPKAKPTASLNATKIPLQINHSTKKIKVTDLANGDSIVSWKSSNPKIAKVNAKGKIRAGKKSGKAIITVKLASCLEKKITVTVQKKKVTTRKLTALPTFIDLDKGDTIDIYTSLIPITSQEKITFSSTNKKIASVTKDGLIKTHKRGKATIIVKSGKKKAKVKVLVK